MCLGTSETHFPKDQDYFSFRPVWFSPTAYWCTEVHFSLLLGICFKLKKEAKFFFFSRLLLLSLPEADLMYRKVNVVVVFFYFIFFNPQFIPRRPGSSAYGWVSGCFCQICVHQIVLVYLSNHPRTLLQKRSVIDWIRTFFFRFFFFTRKCSVPSGSRIWRLWETESVGVCPGK